MNGLTLPDRVLDLARRLGVDESALPAYVYDLQALAAHTAAIRAALPPSVELFYAVKANPDPAVLATVARYADGLEVSSAGELRHASAAVAGCRLAFSGPGKTGRDLAAALEAGAVVHVESPHELRLLAAAARAAGRAADVLLRVNLVIPGEDLPGGAGSSAAPAGEVLRMGGNPGPFGMMGDLLGDCAEVLRANPGPLRLRGLHAHLASGLNADALLERAAWLLAFGRSWWARHGSGEPVFNLGGGMAVDYRRPDVRFDWERYGQGLAELALPGETLRVEPGRSVSAYCGWYITRVLDVKRSGGEAFAVVAGGTHHLRTPAAKGHDQPFTVLGSDQWTYPWPRLAARAEPVTITGQLCTPKDVLARRIPVDTLRAGDLVAFGLAGAYAWNISHHSFLMHPAPSFHYTGLEQSPREASTHDGM